MLVSAIHPQRPAVGRGPTLVAVIVASLVLVHAARAQSEVRVRAGTHVDMLRAEQDAGTTHVWGRLLDDVDRPLAGAVVSLVARDRAATLQSHLTVTTEADGAFEGRFALPAADLQFAAEYGGDAFHDPAEHAVAVDATRASVRLAWTPPPGQRFDLDAAEQHVTLRAESRAGGAGLAVEVRDELDRVVARGTTDANGQLAVALEQGVLGAPGAGVLSARSLADDTRLAGHAEMAVLRVRRSRIEATAAFDGTDVRVEGILRDTQGGLARKAVGIFASDAHLATVWTDHAGRFALRLAPPRVDASTDGIEWEARFDSDAPWIESSRSARLHAGQASGRPSHLLWIVASMAVSALLLFATRARRRADVLPTAAPDVAPGIYAPKRRHLFAARRWELAGQIIDAAHGHALPFAGVGVEATSRQRVALPVDELGCFASGPLPQGRWTLHVEANGYAPAAASFGIPHRGECSDVRVRLENLRSVAESRYRPVATALLPDRALWYFWSARETLAHSDAIGRSSAVLARLTDRVERACYGPHAPSIQDLDAIADDANTLRAPPALAGARPPDPR